MKKIFVLFITVLCLVGCASKVDVPSTTTGIIATTFVQEIQKTDNLDEIGLKIIESVDVEYDLDMNHVYPGYLLGFSQDIVHFEDAVIISPIVGTIPFVCYVFQTSEPELLTKEIENYHDMRWNICTEAEEKILKQDHNFVLFAMTPAN